MRCNVNNYSFKKSFKNFVVSLDITSKMRYTLVVIKVITTCSDASMQLQEKEIIIMSKVSEFLTENPVQYLATVSLDGKAKCRPFMFSFEKDGKLWFNTGNFKEVYKELQANPYVQISVASPTYQWIRLSGKAVFVDDKAIKEAALENPIVKGNYQTADNPAFEVFYLEDAHGVIADFSGNPPYEF